MFLAGESEYVKVYLQDLLTENTARYFKLIHALIEFIMQSDGKYETKIGYYLKYREILQKIGQAAFQRPWVFQKYLNESYKLVATEKIKSTKNSRYKFALKNITAIYTKIDEAFAAYNNLVILNQNFEALT